MVKQLLILKIVFTLLIIIALFMIFPLIIAFYYGEAQTYTAFALPLLGALFILTIVLKLLPSINTANMPYFSPLDGALLVFLCWLAASLFASLPFMLSGAIAGFTDAFFETMSGFTTTGATILTEIESLPKSMLFWRSLTHWLGGMGIVVLTVALFPLLGIGGLQLLRAEAPGPTVDKISPTITKTAKYLWLIYLSLTVIETTLLCLGGMTFLDAVTHTFATLATGGFSTKNNSVGFYDSPYIQWVITIFMILAGINFTVYFRLITGRIKNVIIDSELKLYLSVFIVSTLVVTLALRASHYATFEQAFRYAGFQVASILTTTGFATADYLDWPYFAQIIIFCVMLVGGCAGSTGGGIKVVRLVIMLKQCWNEIKRFVWPNTIFIVKINQKMVQRNIVFSVFGFFFLYMLMLLLTTLVVASGGYSPMTAISSALATVGNIGPGFALVGPSENYAFFPAYIKWTLSLAMLIGRLEIYTVFAFLALIFSRR